MVLLTALKTSLNMMVYLHYGEETESMLFGTSQLKLLISPSKIITPDFLKINSIQTQNLSCFGSIFFAEVWQVAVPRCLSILLTLREQESVLIQEDSWRTESSKGLKTVCPKLIPNKALQGFIEDLLLQ